MKKKAIPCHKAGRITSFFLLISIFLLIPSITTPVYAVETYTQQTVFTLHATNKTVNLSFCIQKIFYLYCRRKCLFR